MLQQTQVKTVAPYYYRFLERFPDVQSLARTSESEILKLWSGLGYYSRARNLHKAARQIVKGHGSFPEDFRSILALPGVGRYTAGAICSLAFGQAQPVVDANIRRVIARLHGIRGRAPESCYWNQMSVWIPERNASSFNQAMMELGALVCVPFEPHCPQCPAESFCEARKMRIQDRIPSPRPKRASKHRRIVMLVLRHGGRILLTSSSKANFIPGRWGLPCKIASNRESAEEAASLLCRRILGRAIPLVPCAQIRHSISDYRILAYGFCGNAVLQGAGGFRWARRSSTHALLTSSLYRKVLHACGQLPGRPPA
jgi:A/G-specific adenine glycosylase